MIEVLKANGIEQAAWFKTVVSETISKYSTQNKESLEAEDKELIGVENMSDLIFKEGETILDVDGVFSQKGLFALLIVLTKEGETRLRPIGGAFPNGINDAIEEMDKKFPGCKMKFLERDYTDWDGYYRQNGIPKERIL